MVFILFFRPATVCDWEGTPAHIVYEHPYIIAIDPYFIEIRHVDTVSLTISFYFFFFFKKKIKAKTTK